MKEIYTGICTFYESNDSDTAPMAGSRLLKAEIVRTVSGTGVFKLHPVGVVGLAGHHGQAVEVIDIQVQVLLIDFRNVLYGKTAFAGDNGHVKFIFQVIVYGAGGNLPRQLRHDGL